MHDPTIHDTAMHDSCINGQIGGYSLYHIEKLKGCYWIIQIGLHPILLNL